VLTATLFPPMYDPEFAGVAFRAAISI
jgi:hypothetical protein